MGSIKDAAIVFTMYLHYINLTFSMSFPSLLCRITFLPLLVDRTSYISEYNPTHILGTCVERMMYSFILLKCLLVHLNYYPSETKTWVSRLLDKSVCLLQSVVVCGPNWVLLMQYNKAYYV